MPARHFPGGFSMMVVSYIVRSALSVALSDRPTVPKTVSTSGKERMIRSWTCSNCVACVMEIPGSDVVMYSAEPSYNAGINWLPSFHGKGKLAARNARSASSVVLDRKSTRLNSSHRCISYADICLKKKTYLITPDIQNHFPIFQLSNPEYTFPVTCKK